MTAILVRETKNQCAVKTGPRRETHHRPDRSIAARCCARAHAAQLTGVTILPGLTPPLPREREVDEYSRTDARQDPSTHYAKVDQHTQARARSDSRVDRHLPR